MKLVTATLKDKYRTEIFMDNHQVTADEPASAGGEDLGPNPYDLVLASLAACTAMTVRWYADRKQLDLTGCEVTLEYDRIHAKDCEECDQSDPMRRIEHIKRTVEISGRFSAEEKEKLNSIPSKCPVSRTLKNGIAITDEVFYV